MRLVRQRKKFLGVCVLTIAVMLLAYRGVTNSYHATNDVTILVSPKHRTNFLVDTPTCKIPDMDPFDPTIRHLISRSKSLKCSENDGLTYQIGNTVHVNQTVVNKLYAKVFTYCDSDTVLRVNKNTDNFYYFVTNNGTFKDSYALSKEFTRITCYKSHNTTKKVIHRNFYLINTPKLAAEKRYKKSFHRHVETNAIKHSYNVVLMGIDSVSRLNFQRHISQTREFLLNKLKAVEITGYTRIADNTFPNLTPLLTGKFIEELPYVESRDNRKPFDRFDMIFKRFAAAGYRTSYAEDDPYIATFNLNKEGFHKQPTDDYMRPMSLAIEQEKVIHEHCVHERAEQSIYTDNVHRFMMANEMVKRPYFSLTFLSRITHNYVNQAPLVDAPHVHFLHQLHRDKLLNNTILLYFSDHGMRYGPIRDTYIGRISTHLPAMYIYLPSTFKRDYLQLYKNIQTNAHRITTAFDIYETLRDILNFNDSVGRTANISHRGISLFSEIPASRTCNDAGILPHWCACGNRELLPVNDILVVRAAHVLLQHLNKLLNISASAVKPKEGKQIKSNLENKSARNVKPKEGKQQINILNKTERTVKPKQLNKPESNLLKTSPCEVLQLDRITTAYKVVPNIKFLTYILEKDTYEKVHNINTFHKKMSVSLHYEIVMVTTPGGGRFEATVKHNTRTDAMVVVGDVSRTNMYGETSWCVDDTTLKKFCYCKQQK